MKSRKFVSRTPIYFNGPSQGMLRIFPSGDKTEMEWKWNGDGMEIKMTNQVEAKFDGMEWEGNGNGMEKVGEKIFCKMDLEMKRIGNGMEMEIIIRLVWNWGGAV